MKKKKFTKELVKLIDNANVKRGFLQSILVYELLNTMQTTDPKVAFEKTLNLLAQVAPELGVSLVLNPTQHTVH